jgi:exportin-1
MAEIVAKCQSSVLTHVPTMLDCIFEPTLQMITRNFEDSPEIREGFYHFLNMVVQHCFEGPSPCLIPLLFSFALIFSIVAILRMQMPQQTMVVKAVIWGFRHTMNTVAETSLIVLPNYGLEEALYSLEC